MPSFKIGDKVIATIRSLGVLTDVGAEIIAGPYPRTTPSGIPISPHWMVKWEESKGTMVSTKVAEIHIRKASAPAEPDPRAAFPRGAKVQLRPDFFAYFQAKMNRPPRNPLLVQGVMGKTGEVEAWRVDTNGLKVICVDFEDCDYSMAFEADFLVAPGPTKKTLHENCPKCGHRGHFIRMALACPTHGVWAGC